MRVRKAVILRPGALGDVLVARGVIRLFKELYPVCEVGLVAPGERGAFLCRPGWADAWLDWDSAAVAWLFSSGETPPPERMKTFFADCEAICAFMDWGDAAERAGVVRKLETLAPRAAVLFRPSRPEAGRGEAIGEWLIRCVWAFLAQRGAAPPEREGDVGRWASATVLVPTEGCDEEATRQKPYVVLHPGSGGKRKNWPEANYARLGALLLAERKGDGEMLFRRAVVTSGEADGDLGARVAAAIPGARQVFQPSLEGLARIIAGAALYVGNDSGVSHLASAVMDEAGHFPCRVVLFGPTDATIWAPPGSVTLRAGEGMDALPAETAWRDIRAMYSGGGGNPVEIFLPPNE